MKKEVIIALDFPTILICNYNIKKTKCLVLLDL